MTTKLDPNVISMCPEHPQNLKRYNNSIGNPVIEHAERLGWKSLDLCGTVFGRDIENTIEKYAFYPYLTEIHIPTNMTASNDDITTWECYRLLVPTASGRMICVDYKTKAMFINELDVHHVLEGPHGKVNKYLIYGAPQDPSQTYYNSYWDFISPCKHDDYGYFFKKEDAMNFAVQLLAIDKAKIEMEMLKVQLKLI